MLLRAREGAATTVCIGRHPNNPALAGLFVIGRSHCLGHVVCQEG